MSSTEWPEIAFDDLMGTTRFDISERAHIVMPYHPLLDSLQEQARSEQPRNEQSQTSSSHAPRVAATLYESTPLGEHAQPPGG